VTRDITLVYRTRLIVSIIRPIEIINFLLIMVCVKLMAAVIAIRIVVRMVLGAKSLVLLTRLVVYHANFDRRSNSVRTFNKHEGR